VSSTNRLTIKQKRDEADTQKVPASFIRNLHRLGLVAQEAHPNPHHLRGDTFEVEVAVVVGRGVERVCLTLNRYHRTHQTLRSGAQWVG
jgi:hypothetical protein